MDLWSHFRDVYKLSCKTMVVITGAEFAVVLMEVCDHVCRYFTSVINRNSLIITVANVIFMLHFSVLNFILKCMKYMLHLSCQMHNISLIQERDSIALTLNSTTEED